MEIALEDLQESLRHDFSTDETGLISLETAGAFLRRHTPLA
jgi:hypothetical protein